MTGQHEQSSLELRNEQQSSGLGDARLCISNSLCS